MRVSNVRYSADPDVSRHGLESIWCTQIGLVRTAQLIAAARCLAVPGRISRVPSPWVGQGLCSERCFRPDTPG